MMIKWNIWRWSSLLWQTWLPLQTIIWNTNYLTTNQLKNAWIEGWMDVAITHEVLLYLLQVSDSDQRLRSLYNTWPYSNKTWNEAYKIPGALPDVNICHVLHWTFKVQIPPFKCQLYVMGKKWEWDKSIQNFVHL